MTVFLERIDSAPLQNENFSFEFYSWVTNFIDTANRTTEEIQNLFNQNFGPQGYTTAQITAMAVNARDGVFWYCTDHVPPCPVMKVNGILVQLVTAPFP